MSALLALALCAGTGHAVPQSHFASAPLADMDGDRIFEELEARLAVTRADQSLPVIVRYREGCEQAAVRIADRVCCRLERDRSVVARLMPGQIQRLAASREIESIETDGVLYPTRDTAEASFGTARAIAEFGLSGDADGNPRAYSARDLTIAVIDTGIDPKHPDFAGGKIIAWKDFIDGRPEPWDDDGHGTHVASIAAGGVVNGVGGVAPSASLIGLKVFKRLPDGTMYSSWSDTIRAIDWCIDNRERYGIDVINLSLGAKGPSAGIDATCRAVDRASAAGIVVCVAAGNNGPDLSTIGTPGAAAGAITVGNMADVGKGGFYLEPSSSRGPTLDGRLKPDVCAPGVNILAARANRGGYIRLTGTSMASPFVAGVAALLLQADPQLSPEQVKAILKETAWDFGLQGEDVEYGAGRLDAYAAIARALGRAVTPSGGPDHLFGQGSLAGTEDGFTWLVPIDDTRFPIAATLIQFDTNVDLDLYVYDPDGRLVVTSAGRARQETISFRPARTGTYSFLVYSAQGASRYRLDISAGSSIVPAAE